MSSTPIPVTRTGVILKPDLSRVLLRPFNTVAADTPDSLDAAVGKSYMMSTTHRARQILDRIMAMEEAEVEAQLQLVKASFSGRHRNTVNILHERFGQVRHLLASGEGPSEGRKLLIGSYFLSEYSFESAALFNPSIVPHPDQSGLPEGGLRFMLSLRSTGEGHISSITFREGTIGKNRRIEMTPASHYATEPLLLQDGVYDKDILQKKISVMGETVESVMNGLPGQFSLPDLRTAINQAISSGLAGRGMDEVKALWTLAISNYEVQFGKGSPASERVLFPSSPSQSNGIEDARFVLFHDDDGSRSYYATYTAYDGHAISPQLLQTDDFLRFRFTTLGGRAVSNKGMALFPRKIDGKYVMLSRQDNQNVLVMFSDSIHFWDEAHIVVQPRFPWEFVQLGNCGSPLETEDGWLVLTHGVGPVRRYCIGVALLDKKDPRKLLGRMRTPLIEADESEREGYVPNVVYTCGAMLVADTLVVPYAVSDCASTFATISLSAIMNAME